MRKFALVLVVSLVACGDGADTDSGPLFTQRLFDETVTQAMTAYEEVADETWEERSLDFATCETDPAPDGTFCTFQAQVVDFQEDEFLLDLAGTTVKVFPSNQVLSLDVSCAAPATSGSCPATPPVCYQNEANSDGTIEFPCMPCNTRFAVWTYKASSITPLTKQAIEFNHWVDANTGVQEIITVSVKTYGLIPGIVGFQPDPTMGIVGGEIQDCAGRTIRYAHTNIDRGELDTPGSSDWAGDDEIYGVGTFYFVNNFPQKQQSVTSQDGLWAFVNVPADQVTVFASGRRNEGAPVVANVGRVSMACFPDTITIGDIILEGP